MKKSLIFFLYCLLILGIKNGFSQQSFIWNIPPDHGYDYFLETSPNCFYFIGGSESKEYPSFVDSARLLKRNFNNGDSIVKLITKDTQIYNHVYLPYAIPHSNNGFVAIGTLGYRNNPDTNVFWMLGFDSLMNQLWEVQYPLARNDLIFQSVKKLKNNNWLVAFKSYNPNWIVHDQFYLIEITENGSIEHVIPADTCSEIFDVAIHPVTGNIYCMGNYIDPGYPSNTWMKILDSNYNAIAFKPVFPYNHDYSLMYPFGGEWMNGDTLLFSAMKADHWATPQDEDVCIYYMKETDSIVPLKESCFRRPHTKDYTVWKGYGFTLNNQIIQLGALDELDWGKTWIGCYDKQLNLQYHHIITSQEWQNGPWGVFPTSDSGYLVKNIVYDFMGTGQSSYMQIIKFDKNGNCSALEVANSKIKVERHLVYPNPGKDYFMLELSRELLDKGQCILELYAANGRLQNQWTFEGNQVQIITTAVPTGLYFYRVLQNNKPIASGKWLKQ